MQALQDGDKARADELKQQLKDANTTVKVLKEQEKLTKEEKEKAEKVTQPPQDNSAESGGLSSFVSPIAWT